MAHEKLGLDTGNQNGGEDGDGSYCANGACPIIVELATNTDDEPRTFLVIGKVAVPGTFEIPAGYGVADDEMAVLVPGEVFDDAVARYAQEPDPQAVA